MWYRTEFTVTAQKNQLSLPNCSGWVAQSLEHWTFIFEVPGSNFLAAQPRDKRLWRSAKDSFGSMQPTCNSAKWTGNRDHDNNIRIKIRVKWVATLVLVEAKPRANAEWVWWNYLNRRWPQKIIRHLLLTSYNVTTWLLDISR